MGDPRLRPYQTELQAVAATLRGAVADSKASVDTVAAARALHDLMELQLTLYPYGGVLKEFDGKADPQTGYRNEKYWRLVMEGSVQRDLHPLDDPDNMARYRQLRQDYMAKALDLINLPYKGPTRSEDRVDGIVYLIRPDRDMLKKAMPLVASELIHWFNSHRITKDFLARPASLGYYQFLMERPDVQRLLRVIDERPLDVTAYSDPSIITTKTQTAQQAVIEIFISFIPVVGEVVAGYEATSGADLFGNSLGPVERGVMGVTMLLPMLGMLVKDARPVYTETRLALMYGGKASEWEHALTTVGRLEAKDTRVLAEAADAVRQGKLLGPGLARRAAAALPEVAKPAGLLQSSVDKAVSEAFAVLSKRHPIVATLDEFAVLRLLEKGPHPDLIKGQLLEELIESRLVPWLADPNGYTALGLELPVKEGSHILFIPGHMITDIHGRQLTDGVLASWKDNELFIHVIFEAKAGKSAARELRVGKGGISSLSDLERAQLRVQAERTYRNLKRRAQLQGLEFKRTLADVEKEELAEIRFSESGGQVRRDVERLHEDENGVPSYIYVGDLPNAVPVRMTPQRTRIFGVLPADVDPTSIQSSLRGLGYNFEVIRAAIRQSDLKAISDHLTPVAQQMADALLKL